MGPRLRSSLVSVVALAGAWAGPAIGARVDPAPIPDEVVRKLVHEPLRRQAGNAPERLERHLDATLALLERMDAEGSHEPGPDSRPAASGTSHMLLGAKLHDLTAIRDQLREEAAAIRARLLGLGAGKTSAWGGLVARIEARFAEVHRLLGEVQGSTTRGARQRALAAARAHLRALYEARTTREAATGMQPVPTLRHERAPLRSPDPDDAPPPQYARPTSPLRMYAFAGERLVLDAATPVPGQEGTCQYTDEDLGRIAPPRSETEITTELDTLAQSLERSPAKIYQWVSNEIAFEPYYGSLKGAMGTLYSKAGNATDHASLLIALLRASSIPARYVKGTIRFVRDPRLLRWVGAKDYPGAAEILAEGGMLQKYVEAEQRVELTHVWVEACVPYTNYRGTSVDSAGHRWIPLDASFKDRSYQTGIPGIVENVSFEYTAYLSSRSATLPEEQYANLVEAHIQVRDPVNTLADVPYRGVTVPRTVDILPASVPYEVVRFNVWDSRVRLADVAEVPPDHRYHLEIIPEDGRTPEHVLTQYVKEGAPLQIPPSGCGLDPFFIDFVYCVSAVVLPVPDVVLKRITLSFRGATAEDEDALGAWRNSPDQTLPLPCTKTVSGVDSALMVDFSVRVDGEEKLPTIRMGPPPPSVGLCTADHRLTLRIGLYDGGGGVSGRPFAAGDGTSPWLNAVVFRNIQPANYYALLGYAFQASERLLVERAGRLLASVQATPTPSADPDSTVGEFLHLVGLKYMRHFSDGIERIGALDGGSGRSGNHLGLTSSRMKVAYVFDEPFAVYRNGFLVDVPGGRIRNVDLATGAGVWSSFKLMTYNGSAQESFVWQENARLDAVSTVRGMQFALENGARLVTITDADKDTTLPELSDYLEAERQKIKDELAKGFTVIAPSKRITYGDWTGIVWMQEKHDTATGIMEMGAAISGGYKGAFTVGEPISPGLTFTLALPPPPVDDILSVIRFGNGREQGFGVLVTSTGDPVNMVTGNLYHSERDLAIKGRGLPLVFERSYNSRAPKDGPLGFGWTHSFDHSLVFNDEDAAGNRDGLTSSVSWVDGTGTEKIIQVSGGPDGVPSGASFRTPAGLFFRMARSDNGTYTIREKNGLTYTFESVAGAVGQRARLLRIEDRNGNGLTLSHDAAIGRLASVSDDVGVCPGTTCRRLDFEYDVSRRITRITDWTGRQHEYDYDVAGNLKTYRNPLAVRGLQPALTYSYYPEPPFTHAMERYTLPRGNSMRFEYYANGKVFRHANTLGETTTFTYNEFRRETIAVNERGHIRRFVFDQRGNPVKIVEENGGERLYTYEDLANPLARTWERNPLGHETRYCYDRDGNVTRVIPPPASGTVRCDTAGDALTVVTGVVAYESYNTFGQPGRIRDVRGNHTLLAYDDRGNLLETLRLKGGLSAPANPASPTAGEVAAWTINTPDAFGNVASTKRVKDVATRSGPTEEYDYNDPVNHVVGLNLVVVTRLWSDGTEYARATLEYDALGRVKKGLRPDWYATQAGYDDVDRVIVASDDFGRLREYAYDANGNLASSALVNGDVADGTSFTYDLSDRRSTRTDAGGFITNFRYDAAGNLIAVTNPDGFTLRFEYDPGNHVTRASDQEGNAVTRDLDLDGRPRAITDPNGNTVRYAYHGPGQQGRLRSVTDGRTRAGADGQREPAGRVTRFDYDENGNVTTVTGAPSPDEPGGRTTRTSYDELNRPLRVAGPAYRDDERGGVIRPLTTYRYDVLGRLEEVHAGHIAPTGEDVVRRHMRYEWDDFGAKLKEVDGADRTWEFTPDIHGSVATATDPRRQLTIFTYDYGRLKRLEDHLHRVTSYVRNDLGQVRVAQSPDVTYEYTYDAAHRLASVTDGRAGKQLTYAWSPGGLLNRLENSDGNRTDYEYDATGRLTGIWAPNGDLVTFVHDAAGRLTQKWLPNGVATLYSYNTDNTLAAVVNRAGGAVVSDHVYGYDDAGNRNLHEETIGGATLRYEYDHDALDRLVEVRNTSATPIAVERFTYDPLGNRTSRILSDVTLAYRYDPLTNQLMEVLQGTTPVAAFEYDPNGNVITKTEGTIVTTLDYDALNRLTQARRTNQPPQTYAYDDQGRRIRKTVGSGATGSVTNYLYNGQDIAAEYSAAWGAPVAVYTHGAGTDTPLIRSAAGVATYYHQDGLGSIVGLTGGPGTATVTTRYDAWGNTLGGTGPIPRYGYTGREPDETGLIYYRARYYDPTVGRFTQRDPIGLAGGLNPYAYAGGNPTSRTDPLGLLPAIQNPTDAIAGTLAAIAGILAQGSLTSGAQTLAPDTSGDGADVGADLATRTPDPQRVMLGARPLQGKGGLVGGEHMFPFFPGQVRTDLERDELGGRVIEMAPEHGNRGDPIRIFDSSGLIPEAIRGVTGGTLRSFRQGTVRWGPEQVLDVRVILSAVTVYQALYGGRPYDPFRPNSNYFVNLIISVAGGNPTVPGAFAPLCVPTCGLFRWR